MAYYEYNLDQYEITILMGVDCICFIFNLHWYINFTN